MQERERRHDDAPPGGEPPVGSPGNGGLDHMRRAGEDFLAAGDDAISRALSGDSEKFLSANKQSGGE